MFSPSCSLIVLFVLLLSSMCSSQSLPRLNIIDDSVTVSGISSGADVAVQMLVAFSGTVKGACIFAGETFGAAVVRQSNEPVQICSHQPLFRKGPGCVHGANNTPAPCIGCGGGTGATLEYDHVKTHPEITNNTLLREVASQMETAGVIDRLSNLENVPVYLYRGTKDAIYFPGSVKAVGDFFSPWNPDIKYEGTIPSQHAMPTLDFGSPCGVKGLPPAIENCGYDGAGVCLNHVYKDLQTDVHSYSGTQGNRSQLYAYDQRLYFSKEWPGLARTGYVYVPKQCKELQPCRLHVVLHGCTMFAGNPDIGLNYTLNAGYNPWADTASIVLLFPQNGGYSIDPRHHHTNSFQELSGCWDSYGQTGINYANKQGLQMQTVYNMIEAIIG